MPKHPPMLDHILELMKPLGGVTARAMFGGHGISKNKTMFAILVDGELYFKVTDNNRTSFEERGLGPFTYDRKGKTVAMSYYAAPAECLDDARFMTQWAEEALKAARE